jgi:hypothetical protein
MCNLSEPLFSWLAAPASRPRLWPNAPLAGSARAGDQHEALGPHPNNGLNDSALIIFRNSNPFPSNVLRQYFSVCKLATTENRERQWPVKSGAPGVPGGRN